MSISWRLLDSRRLLVTALCLILWRALDQLPITGLKGQGIQLFQGIGGGGQFGPYSLGSVGIGPYIFALVILSVLPAISGRVWAMKKTADGRASLRRWAIALAILLAFAQAYSITELIQNTRVGMWFAPLDWFTRLVICLELAGGTVIVILLADLIDEFGLGFGYAAFLLFALRAVALQIHRLADYPAVPWPPFTTFLKASAVWAVISVAIVVATVAFVLALRLVSPPSKKKSQPHRKTELNLIPSGVIRPPLIAGVIVSLPLYYAGYLGPRSELTRWIMGAFSAYSVGPFSPWLRLGIAMTAIIGLAVAFARLDQSRTDVPTYLRRHITRFAFVGGCFLAIMVEVVPLLALLITGATGDAIQLSGFDVVVIVVVIMAIATAAQGEPRTTTVIASAVP